MRQTVLYTTLLLLAPVAITVGQSPSFEDAAKQLQSVTVTVRVTSLVRTPASVDADPEEAEDADSVAVCSGVSVGKGLVVTYVSAPKGARFRITLPGGKQSEASPDVIDHYSGLTLLDTGKVDLPGIPLAEDLPSVGAWVLSAAAWGMERPVVSFGILSGKERSIRGAPFPPLLQCDVRTAETSSGAGLADGNGKLVGVVVAADAAKQRGGWTYAVPVDHVKRLLRARDEDKTVVLKRRRPVVGLVLAPGDAPGVVVVEKVTEGGPADKAGVKVGDQVVAADGLNIRSVYQAVVPLMRKQPGDTLSLLVEQPMGRREIEVTLGGGIELPASHQFAGAVGLIDPRVQVARVGPGSFDVQSANGGVRNLAIEPPGEKPESVDQRVLLLQRAIERYASLIQQYRGELSREKQQRAEMEQLIDQLQERIGELTRQLEEAKSSASAPK
jgi:S1-C subfamily serine protease